MSLYYFQNVLENYPETLKAAYVLNASNIFQLVFKIVQSTVQQRTLSKIKIFGKDNWPLDIKKLVDNASVNQGGPVPPSMYYANGNDSSTIILPGVTVNILSETFRCYLEEQSCSRAWENC